MSNYIDRNILLEELNETQIEGDEYYKGLGRAKRIVCDQPTADAQEVKHAKWEVVGNYKVECTNCHHIRDIKTQCGWNFCPTCGAKIDEED